MQPSVGILASINISWGGIPKQRVFEALVTENGLDGDHQRDLRYHGGPERAVVLYSLDVIQALKRQGHPIGVGAVGENFTVSGLDWPAIVPGTELEIGAVCLLITKYASPCEKIRHSFIGEDFSRIAQKVHPGWSRVCARVTSGGIVRGGESVKVVVADRSNAARHR